MSDLNNYRYKNEFYKNLNDAVETLGPDVETDEYENFLINGKELLPEAQLIREKNRILLNFTHLQGQTFDFIKHNSFRILLDDISESILNQSYDFDILKKILVHLDLELGIEVMFTSTLLKMIENGLDKVKDYSQFDKFDYNTLTSHYNDGYKKLR